MITPTTSDFDEQTNNLIHFNLDYLLNQTLKSPSPLCIKKKISDFFFKKQI